MKDSYLKYVYGLVVAGALVCLAPSSAAAQAVVTNGTITIGVNAEGHLNYSDGTSPANSGVWGVAYQFSDGNWYDATSPGCYCEGYGVKVTSGGTDYTGYANVDTNGGAVNLTAGASVSDADSIVTTASITSLPGLTITHDYHPSSSDNLYEVTVTITNNTGATVDDVLYRRVMDWDIAPNEFSEYVTIEGAGLGDLVYSGDNGFCTAEPGPGGCGEYVAGTENVDFEDAGPTDHGAVFDFNFGSLADGESKTFTIYYGAADSEAAALAALAAVGAEGIYSLGQSSVEGTPATYIFGFGGVGAPPIGSTPEPASLLLLGGGLAGAVARRRYRKA